MSAMTLTLDHVNIRTANLERLIAFYGAVLDLTPGWRPDFPFPGAWLYAGSHPVVHLVGVEQDPVATTEGRALHLEHFAFRGQDLRAFLARLAALGIEGEVRAVPGAALTQVNLWDPDGNHLHVDFAETRPQAVQLA